MFLAYVDWELTVHHGVPQLVALPLVVLVLAPLLGIALDRSIMRHLQGKPLVVQLMVTVGLMFAFIGIANMIWNQSDAHSMPALFQGHGFHVGQVLLTWHRFITIMIAVGLAIGLRILLFQTRIGIAMRAVVDNRDLAALGGARSTVLSSVAWALGCSLAALAGILLAPETADMSTTVLTLLIITAFAAAVVGRLRSLPLTYLGALILARRVDGVGLVPQVLGAVDERSRRAADDHALHRPAACCRAPRSNSRASARFGASSGSRRCATPRSGWPSSLVVMIGLSCRRHRRREPRPAHARDVHRARRALARATHRMGRAGVAGAARVRGHRRGRRISASAARTAASGRCSSPRSSPFRSGRCSRSRRCDCRASTSRSQRWRSRRWSKRCSTPNRSRSAPTTQTVAPVHLLGVDFSSKRAFLFLITVVFGLCGIGIVALRRSAFGRRLVALRDSEAASVTVGVNVLETKLGGVRAVGRHRRFRGRVPRHAARAR